MRAISLALLTPSAALALHLPLLAVALACAASPIGDDPVDVSSGSEPSPDASADDSSPAAPDAAEAPPLLTRVAGAAGAHPVGRRTLELVDTTRTTPANDTYAGSPERRLVLDVVYPAEAAESDAPVAAGSFPLVIYAHGFMSDRAENTPLLEYLASHGVIVLAPTFPLSNREAPGGSTLSDTINQPGDVRFLLDHALAGDSALAFLKGRVDPQRVGLAGLSLGGLTAALTGFFEGFRDPRVRVIATLAAPLCLLPADAWPADAPPALFVYGTADQIAPYEANARKALESAKAPTLLATVHGGTHVGFAAVAGPIFADMEDPDQIGCAAFKANVGDQTLAGIAAASGFGGEASDAAACPEPCSLSEWPKAMSTAAQADLITLSVGAFLRGHLQGEPDLLDFVRRGLPAQRAEVTIEAKLVDER